MTALAHCINNGHGSVSSKKADWLYPCTPANANFALGSDVLRGKLKVLHPATRWSRSQMLCNAIKTRETWNTDGS